LSPKEKKEKLLKEYYKF